MKTRLAVALILSLLPGVLYAQCTKAPFVYDDSEDHVLGAKLDPGLEGAVQRLQNQGSQVIVYVSRETSNLDLSVRTFVEACALWTKATEGDFQQLVDDDVILLSVSPKSHMSGVYFGKKWNENLGAVDTSSAPTWSRIRRDANPLFARGLWNEALTLEADGLTQVILHNPPKKSIVVNWRRVLGITAISLGCLLFFFIALLFIVGRMSGKHEITVKKHENATAAP